MDPSEVFYHMGISLGLGLLVGLQRERSDSRLAGFRTFPLITILGTVSSLLSLTFGGWIVALGLVALAGIIIAGNLAAPENGGGRSRPDHRGGGAADVLHRSIPACRTRGGRSRAWWRRRRPAASQTADALAGGEDRRSGFHGDHAVRRHHAGHPAGATEPYLRALSDLESSQDLAARGVDRRH